MLCGHVKFVLQATVHITVTEEPEAPALYFSTEPTGSDGGFALMAGQVNCVHIAFQLFQV